MIDSTHVEHRRLDLAHGVDELRVVGGLAPEQQPERVLVGDDQLEVGAEPVLDHLARSVGPPMRRARARRAAPRRPGGPARGRGPAWRRSVGRGAAWSRRPRSRCPPSWWPGSRARRRAAGPSRPAARVARSRRGAAGDFAGAVVFGRRSRRSWPVPGYRASRAALALSTAAAVEASKSDLSRRSAASRGRRRAARAAGGGRSGRRRAPSCARAPRRRGRPTTGLSDRGRRARTTRTRSAASSRATGYGPDAQRPTVHGRLDGRVAEPLPRRGEQRRDHRPRRRRRRRRGPPTAAARGGPGTRRRRARRSSSGP